ncbi:hemagglutinin repeat-containing protein [Rodentibacter caecimuris]|uniref:two-partner secretion domain-containing protein n=1 Tax=Rodentibacter caecimuris TaxID=1796644 RepID=UPI002248E111|nr:hemagglutinin repeat-containing protein [Rodentibacter heylii]MCX2960374.1 hemagglutinin repeat-containing protein [Rodentibacter heylii]
MNKNRYKLIFSKSKSCLVPVAEYINYESGDTGSVENKEECESSSEGRHIFRLSTFSCLIKSRLLHLGNAALAFLFVVPNTVFANVNSKDIVLDKGNHETKISETTNGVHIIEIAKPQYDGISDNKFQKFNVGNGAVFNNSNKEGSSYLVGHLDKNQNFDKDTAKAILTQVTGNQMSKIKGGLEVFGDKADLLIINPNGININGVQTFNTDRFVASTSNVIDPKNGLKLSVEKGTVTIDKDGIATDGLKYLDIVAKKIEQKGAVRNINDKAPVETNITFVAGSSEYDVKARKVKSKQAKSTEIAITGTEAGAMYGNHIQFITTDTGAGVNHKGIILSEKDIQIENEQGKVEVATLQAKQNLSSKGSKKLDINGQISAGKAINLNSTEVNLKQNTKVSSQKVDISADKTATDKNAKIRGTNVNINSQSTQIGKDSTVIATNLDIKGKNLENSGTIAARFNKIYVEKLNNKKDILAEKTLDISTFGNILSQNNITPDDGYHNNGTIQSKGTANLTFRVTHFHSASHKLPEAREKLTLSAKEIFFDKGSENQLSSSLDINSNDDVFINKGVLTSANQLSVKGQKIINEGLLGAKNSLNLTSFSNITNNATGVLHSDGVMNLNADDIIHNRGEILSKGKITVSAEKLLNDIEFQGSVYHYDQNIELTIIDPGSSRTDYYSISGSIPRLGNNLKISHIGNIRGESDFEFIQKDSKLSDAGITNHGIINIQGNLISNGAKSIINDMRSAKFNIFDYYLNSPANITIKFQPIVNGIEIPLQGNMIYKFNSVAQLIKFFFETKGTERYIKKTRAFPVSLDKVQVLKLLRSVRSPLLQSTLTTILGANWESKSLMELKAAYEASERASKLGSKNIELYPNKKSKILAGSFIGDTNILVNGKRGEEGAFDDKVSIGKHTIQAPPIQLKPFVVQPENNGNSEIDLSTLLELLSNPNLFIDRSFNKKKEDNTNILVPKEDTDLLGETEEEKKQRLEKERLFEKERLEEAERRKKQLEEEQKKLESLSEQEKQRLEEYEKKLAEEKRKADELAKQKEIPLDKDRARVEVDPLYHTRMKYINQNDYVGSDYFFNNIAPRGTEDKVSVIGDSYFEHQLITRSIEKKVDNHLALKYDLTNVELVKRLMDNAYHTSGDLNLTLGKALTKEQQDNLKEDIIWYVKSTINGKETYIPQVYFAKQTLEDAEKYKGLGSAVIKARELKLKAKDVQNSGTIAGSRVDIEAENKIKNTGDILGKELVRLKGHKGIESSATSYADEKGNTVIQKSRIASEQHLHLETDLDSDINITASDVKAKTGFVKTKDLKAKDSHKFSSSHKQKEILATGLFGIQKKVGGETEDTYSAESVGSELEFDHLHLAVKGDVEQTGSKIKADRVTGVIQGDYKTKTGQNIKHTDKSKGVFGIFASALAAGGGKSVSASADSVDGVLTQISESDYTGANAELGIKFEQEKSSRTDLKNVNSELDAKSGDLQVLGTLDIGGLDINKSMSESASELTQSTTNEEANKTEDDNSTDKASEVEKPVENNQTKGTNPNLRKLSKEEIEELMAEKDQAFFDAQKNLRNDKLKLTAKEIISTKYQDETDFKSSKSSFKLGLVGEAHSAVADIVSHSIKQAEDAKKGIKQDGTAALQVTSDIANLVTGDLVGGSVKAQAGYSQSNTGFNEKSDNRNTLNGNLVLSATEGGIELNNVERSKSGKLSLNAKDKVTINAGKTERTESDESWHAKVSAGGTVSCGVMSQGCAVGVTNGVEAGYSTTNTNATTYQNSQLLGDEIEINTESDLTLSGANIKADVYRTKVEGKTSIESKQDTYERHNKRLDVGVSVGASVTTALTVKPTGSVTVGYGQEDETSRMVNQQSGIEAGKMIGQIKDLDLTAGYFVDKSGNNDLTTTGSVTHRSLEDYHHKDGGEFGASIGLNERGTSQANIRGGRSAQKHYDATQHSTLSGIDSQPVEKPINQDLNKSKTVHRDEQLASTSFGFELGDLAELGQKGLNKAKQALNKKSNQNSARGLNDIASNNDQLPKPKQSQEPIYEEIPDSPYAKLGDANANAQRKSTESDPIYSEVTKPKQSQEPIYEEIPDSPYAKLGDANANAQRKSTESDPIYSEVTKPKQSQEPIYEEIPDSPYAKLGDSNAQAKSGKSEPIYEEIPALTQENKAKRPLPELPQSGNTKANSGESDYAEIPAVVSNKAKAENAESDYAEIPALAKTGNKSDNVESSLAQANSNNNNSRVLPTMPETANVEQTGAQSAPSFFQKIKNFFKTDRTSSKKAEENANKGNQTLDTEAQANGKPNYEKLEDNLNLKELLSLEAKRYDEFEQKILNNSEFLAEAREAAKKSVPEAVLKQMAGSPELDDILTDGAKRTERKINEALHFKPSEQEFNAIQQLVKKLPKSDEIMSVPEQTQRIVDALAETSKTIQRSPELKDKLKGAVEEFLNDTKNGLTVESIEKLNHGLRPDEGENRTLYKKESLTKEDAIFSGPQASKLQLAQMVEFINDAKARGVEPSVLSGMVYQRVIAYHPFAEGNGRVARVIVNKLLLDAGYPPFTKFSSKFEETIIPQSDNTKDSASSPEVISEFLRLLGEKSVDEAKPKFAPTEAASNSAGQAEDIYAQIDPSKKRVKTESEAEKAARISKEKDETLGKKQSVPSEDNTDYMTIKRLKKDMTDVDQPTKVKASKESPAVIGNKAKAENSESDYAEIPAVVGNKAKAENAESDYAEIPAVVGNKAKAENAESDYAEIPAVVGNKAKAENAESDYAEIPAVVGNKVNSNNSNNNQRLAEENQIGNDVNKPKIDSKKLFEQAKQKARERDSAKEAEKKLKILAENAESLPKEHLLKALQDLAYGSSVEEATALTNKAKETRNKIHRPDTIEGFEGQNVKNMGKVMSKIELDAAYLQSRGEINQKIVDKLDSNQEFHQLMKQKLSGNEEGIKRLFGLVEQAKFEALKEVTGVEGSRAKVEFTGNNPLSMKQGSYGNDLVQMNATPILSFLRTRKQNNKEILDTIVHELTHHDQAQIIRHKDKLPEHMKPDANLMALNGVYYINSGLTNMQQYKKQPQEREAFFSGHKLGEQLSKLVDKGYTGAKREIQSIEHLPSPNSNLETLKPQSTDLGNNTLIYGLKDGRKELINRANQADKGKRNPILADSYIGELNLGYEFGNLSKLADKVKQGKVTQQDIDHIANFQDLGADNALATSSRSRINQANVEDNKKIITELLNNPVAVDSLKRIAEFNEKEQQLFQKLKQNENLDLDNPKTSPSFTKEQNEAIEQYLSAVGELNRSREDFFSEKTKLIAKETLERGGKVYFALDGLATDTTTFNKDKTQIDMGNLKKLFDPNYEFYNSVTSRELRYLYENYRDNPNLKFTIKDQVIENPLKSLDLN